MNVPQIIIYIITKTKNTITLYIYGIYCLVLMCRAAGAAIYAISYDAYN